MVKHFQVVTQEKMNKTKYHLKFLFNFLFLNTFISSKKKKHSRLGFGLFIRIKIEINFSTNICFNQFFPELQFKKRINTLSVILKKLEGFQIAKK